uniref:Guanine nucleotide-binding protein alpha-2 subunit n=1 Tax=Ganoderma boninense TaxID=34458 RepID=A0A5K1JRV2_9APHY|nr:Guanine nucleotide-binding protein alpha-2 subunit [Ganoderma boninense]
MRKPVKVLLPGSGDSGKSTVLKEMRLAHRTAFSTDEIGTCRQLIYVNLTSGLKCVIEEMKRKQLAVTPANKYMVCLLNRATDLKDHGPFPTKPDFEQSAILLRGLDRLFKPSYVPSDEDIAHSYSRTIGIAERTLRDSNMLVLDVGGQRSERRKWIHCFQDVTSVVFVASLKRNAGCNEALRCPLSLSLVRLDTDTDGELCTPIFFLNRSDLFERKIPTSHIVDFFPDCDGEKGDGEAGREYFKKCFARLAAEERPKGRDVHM